MSGEVEIAKLEKLIGDASKHEVPLQLTLQQYEQAAIGLQELREKLWVYNDGDPNNDVELIINNGDYNVDRNWNLILPTDKQPEVARTEPGETW